MPRQQKSLLYNTRPAFNANDGSEDRLICPICKAKFSRAFNVTRHIREVHNKTSADDNNDNLDHGGFESDHNEDSLEEEDEEDDDEDLVSKIKNLTL
ncbi:hypothetical protein BC941DRAFT_477230 [Chlamydoabsidia padenii]|nr:hypothetical protein BC941DRAFT_477230 [Chlamydoabsidia padenii]